jgi:hypothetical protein
VSCGHDERAARKSYRKTPFGRRRLTHIIILKFPESDSHDEPFGDVTEINVGFEGLTAARCNITFRIVTSAVQQTSTNVSKEPAAPVVRSEQSCRWKQNTPPKYSQPSITLRGVTSQKTVIFKLRSCRNSVGCRVKLLMSSAVEGAQLRK